MQRNYFTILFFIKKSKLLKNGEAPICMRITVSGQRAEIQIKRSVDISKWNSQKECVIGKERKSMELNHYLDTVRMKVLQIHRELEQDGKTITADVLKRRYNATVKYLKNFKKIIKMALVNKWITDDPFLEIHFKQTKTNRAFLTEEELNILLKKEFTISRLQTIRDIFVFCALTGLAFTDV